ncbi:cytochrome c, mono- and diheme variants family [Burkholderiales bacterium JOSHI_001]|nr:cytochrome c, mono- and diheme variants family [Burkholderiales bacterium JOSHI_001]
MAVAAWGFRRWAAAALAAAAAAAAAADPAPAPFALDDAARIEAGRQRFGRTCAAYCHGKEGTGGRAPAFKGNTDLTPALAFQTITEGRRGGSDVMPPWGNAYSPEQIWELVAYLMFLGRQAPP